QGDALEVLKTFPDECVDTIVTSPPYWLCRDYKVKGQLGQEKTLEKYLQKTLQITAELKRVLKPKGVMFWVHGNSYAGKMGKRIGWSEYTGIANIDNKEARKRGITFNIKPEYSLPRKCLINQNLRLLLRLTDEQGWINRNTIVWYKPNPLPMPHVDRLTNSYETIFMLVKNQKYFYDLDPIRSPLKHPKAKSKNATIKHEGYGNPVYSGFEYDASEHEKGKNPGDVWTIPTESFPESHYAVFNPSLIEPLIKSACPKKICKRCGKPRERINEIIGKKRVSWGVDRKARVLGTKGQPAMKNITKTVGWTDCGCGEGWTKGVVLDCFMGSGTTALVALILKRNFVGIELNPKDIEMAKTRTKPRNVERERKKLFEKKTIEEKVASWEEQTRLEDFQEVI
ncbi:MAG: site-specific DNA-methyltransferase, partial [Candidatus Heimdallarchaeota archaeon]|nr:site-specific DNA-methyltransferase [Candidatus Heimdallarchaeota archaeon]MCK4611549.1 site-specific DNA-methyltransferase [Candidatus Heimdallarchaeota archaeon]